LKCDVVYFGYKQREKANVISVYAGKKKKKKLKNFGGGGVWGGGTVKGKNVVLVDDMVDYRRNFDKSS